MNIGIDIDGVLTFEHKLESFENPYKYEYRKFNWTREILDDYRKKYFWHFWICNKSTD